ncbi:MAG: hypothetical protein K9N46_16875 [Candidatus Marinimicrobia bacterium]|nr:hypothetical protein [Candidatus Neomarinimicrobiota bacterium]MCF7830334.1 hypothetical protein [Candidatus Neomarinimicrobiota bacterium]MCF7882403.1 hypothetical protein [Candidatus Neomarinimicrobiota bacterium]
MKTVKSLLVAVALLGFSVGVSAQGMHGMQGNQGKVGQMGGHGGMMGMMQGMHGGGMMSGMHDSQGMMGQSVPSVKTILVQANALELTGDQVQTLKKQASDLQKQVIRLKADAKIAGLDLAQALNSNDLKQKDVENALENRHAQKLKIQKTLLNSYFDGLDVLTEEQRAQVSVVGGGCGMMGGMHGKPDKPGQSGSHMGGMMQDDHGDME